MYHGWRLGLSWTEKNLQKKHLKLLLLYCDKARFFVLLCFACTVLFQAMLPECHYYIQYLSWSYYGSFLTQDEVTSSLIMELRVLYLCSSLVEIDTATETSASYKKPLPLIMKIEDSHQNYFWYSSHLLQTIHKIKECLLRKCWSLANLRFTDSALSYQEMSFYSKHWFFCFLA